MKDFKEDTITFEYRTDPLTGRNTTVIRGMLDYIGKFMVSDEKLLISLVEKTRVNCPFCPESVKEKTPMFTHDFIKEGRIFVGDAVVIPNLLGHGERSILVVMSKEHHLKLRDFTAKMIFDGFKGGAAYLKRLSEVDPFIRFPVFIFNYLPPAGLLELSDREWLGMAEGLSKILQFYHKQGYISFNAIIVSGPMNKHLDYFDVNLRVMSRPGIQALSFTDAWALPYLLWDGEAVEAPELFAEKIRAFIKELHNNLQQLCGN